MAMTEDDPSAGVSPADPLARIEAAIARIERAARRRAAAADSLQARHGVLKARMVEAVAALDELLARGGD